MSECPPIPVFRSQLYPAQAEERTMREIVHLTLYGTGLKQRRKPSASRARRSQPAARSSKRTGGSAQESLYGT